jgi:chemotaxis protein histidine kinase CheA
MDKLKEIFASIFSTLARYTKIFAKFVHQKSKDSPFLTKSLILHIILLFLVSGLLPKCSPDIEKPKIIEVSIIPMQVSDVVESKQPPKKKPEPIIEPKKVEPPKEEEKKPEPKKEIEKEKPKPKPKPKPKQVETKKIEEKKSKPESNIPALKKEEVKEKPKKIEEPIKEEKPEEKKQESDEEREGKKSLLKDLEKKESIDDLFEDLAEDKPAKPEEIEEKKPDPIKVEEPVKQEKPAPKTVEKGLTDEEERELGSLISKVVRGQVTQCWSIPIGAKNVENTTVALYIKLDVKGYAKKVNIIDESRYYSDNNYRVLADSAVWAIKECSPFQGLPEDKHEFWKEIQLTFDPSSVL